MNKQEKTRYIMRVATTLSAICTCIPFVTISAVLLGIHVYIVIKYMLPHATIFNRFILFGLGGGILFTLGWLLYSVLFAMLFIRSLWATTEARYPQKLFRRLGWGIAWGYVLNLIGWISKIGLGMYEKIDANVYDIQIYLVGLALSLLLLVPALQFWRPSVRKTWVFTWISLLIMLTHAAITTIAPQLYYTLVRFIFRNLI